MTLHSLADGRPVIVGDDPGGNNRLPVNLSAAQAPVVDDVSGIPISINSEHHEAHEGDSFVAATVDTSMANEDTLSLAFKTPPISVPQKRIHMVGKFNTAAGGHIAIIEGPTWGQGTGTAVPIYNRKRETSMASSGLLEDKNQSTFTASDQAITNVTGVSGGTTIGLIYAFGANNRSSGDRSEEEMLLKPDTQYVVLATADGGSNAIWLGIYWYEHTDSN